jgi:hypothetical protein
VTININSEKLPQQTLTMIFKKLLCRFVGYYNGQYQQFSLDKKGDLVLQERPKTTKNPAIIIIARPFYRESSKQYPIENKGEVKKLLQLELQEQANSYFYNWGIKDNHSLVNIWHFNESVPEAFIRIPESLVIAFSANNHQITLCQTDKPIFVSRSKPIIHSMAKAGHINSSTRFAMSAGITQAHPDKIIESRSIGYELAKGLKSLGLSVLASFVQLPKSENRVLLIKKAVVPFAVLCSAYLIVTSAYLTIKVSLLEPQLSQQGSQVNLALQQQSLFDRNIKRYQSLKSLLGSQHNTAPLWLVMLEVFPQAKFTNIGFINQRIVLRGETTKATSLLEQLTNNPLVDNAKFDFATRQIRKKEVFVISFILKSANITTKAEVVSG